MAAFVNIYQYIENEEPLRMREELLMGIIAKMFECIDSE